VLLLSADFSVFFFLFFSTLELQGVFLFEASKRNQKMLSIGWKLQFRTFLA